MHPFDYDKLDIYTESELYESIDVILAEDWFRLSSASTMSAQMKKSERKSIIKTWEYRVKNKFIITSKRPTMEDVNKQLSGLLDNG